MDEIIINADNAVVGRMSSKIAKELLKGSKVYVVNAERAVISGNPETTLKFFTERVERGDPYHGPFYPRRPDAMVKRMVRGMLPKSPRGRDALKRLRVYISVPLALQDKQPIVYEDTKNTVKGKFVTLSSLSQKLGAKKTW